MAVQWITKTPISGSSGTTQVSVVPQNNTGATTRTGVITVTASRFGRTKTVTVDISQRGMDYSNRYFTTRSLEDGNLISFNIPSGVTAEIASSISYSRDNGVTWTTTAVNSMSQYVFVSDVQSGQTILWKGIASSWSNGGTGETDSSVIRASKNFEIEGNIMSLLYGDNFIDKTSLPAASHTFRHLFRQWPDYPSTLIRAEKLSLPATTLSDGCYYGMFYTCTSLTTAPELPATTLTSSCYDSMFQGCTSLVTAPVICGTTLAEYCCYCMLNDCTSLTTAPALPATTLASHCYDLMFEGCTSLITSPELPATILANWCYSRMFDGCTALTSAPALPATTLANGCYEYMFSNCTSITAAPVICGTTLAIRCYAYMFSNCTSLSTAPALPATTLASSCYQYMFRGCTSLTTAPVLPATTLTDHCYNSMFSGCTALTTAPVLSATTLDSYCYQQMFRGCTSLSTAPSALPATTLASYCYNGMFYGCNHLTTAPELPATTLVNRCYYEMFRSCTRLKYITCLATDINADYCTSNWVNGVASRGTFVKPASTDWSYKEYVDGIPYNWTVIEV